MPFADLSFDFAFMGHVFHEVDDREKSMQEAFRVVKKRLVILEWPYSAGSFGPPMNHRVSKDDIFFEAEKAGFKNLKEEKLKQMSLYILDK